jgi:hypothetical protein
MATPCATDAPMAVGAAAGRDRGATAAAAPVPERPKPHDLATLVTSGYLERIGFDYRPATPATLYRHPSKLGMRA